jgi:nucleoid-associated protein YgaU
VANNTYTLPITAEKFVLFVGGAQPQALAGPAAENGTGGVPVPDLPDPQAPAIPPHIGGGTVPVGYGDNLYDIAGRQYGNPNLYPVLQAANPTTVGADGTVTPGTHLLVPVLPKVPAGSTAQVVRPGQTLWDIAGGDPAAEQRIAELNGITDPAMIYPDQVIVVPPGD